MNYQCPKCGSEHTQSIRGILEDGTSHTSGTYSGTSYGYQFGKSGGPYLGRNHGKMNSTTTPQLAAKFRPPQKPSKNFIYARFIFGFLLVWMACDFHWMAVPGIALIVYGVTGIRQYYYQHDYPAWQRLYNRGFYCHRCHTCLPDVGPACSRSPQPKLLIGIFPDFGVTHVSADGCLV